MKKGKEKQPQLAAAAAATATAGAVDLASAESQCDPAAGAAGSAAPAAPALAANSMAGAEASVAPTQPYDGVALPNAHDRALTAVASAAASASSSDALSQEFTVNPAGAGKLADASDCSAAERELERAEAMYEGYFGNDKVQEEAPLDGDVLDTKLSVPVPMPMPVPVLVPVPVSSAVSADVNAGFEVGPLAEEVKICAPPRTLTAQLHEHQVNEMRWLRCRWLRVVDD